MIWIDTPKKKFMVKSTYYSEKNRFVQVVGESSTTDAHSRVWKAKWN